MADMTLDEAIARLNMYKAPTQPTSEEKKKIKKKEKVKDLVKEDKRATINRAAQRQLDVLEREGY